MDYFNQKINNYKEYTGLSYAQLANLLETSTSTLYAVMRDREHQTLQKDLLNRFCNIIDTLRAIERYSTPWIDLFLPRLPDHEYAFFSYHSAKWFAARTFNDIPPIGSDRHYAYKGDEYNIDSLKIFSLPEFQSQVLPTAASLYEQTPDGWVQKYPKLVNPLDSRYNAYFREIRTIYRNPDKYASRFVRHF